MATLDQLPPEQRAILELIVQRNRSYDDLAGVLDLQPPRVRELAREALVGLAPVTANRVDPDRLGQIADYVLDQQSGAEQTATMAHLRRSEAGRAWTSSLVDSLAHMYDGAPPAIPEAEEAPPRRRRRERERPRERPRERERPRVREPLRRREPEAERPREPLSSEALAAVRRRRVGAALIGIAAIVGIVIGVIAITNGSSKKTSKATAARTQPRILGELLLRPLNGSRRNNQGIAIVAQRGSERDLIVQAKLSPTKQGQAYEVWLYNSKTDAVPVGAQVTDQNGNYQGAGKLPADLSKFQAIDVSLQQIPDQACQRNPACLKRVSAHSGNSVLRGLVADMRAPGRAGTSPTPGGQPTTPGASTGP